MATDPIRLPPGPHADSFAGLVDWLQRDGELRRVVRHWSVLTGDAGTDWLPKPGQSLDGPWVQLTPVMGPSELFCKRASSSERVFYSPLTINVMVAVPSTVAGDTMRIWNRIFDRVMDWPLAAYRALGISDRRPTKPTQGEYENGEGWSHGTGAILLDIYVNG